MGKAKRAHLPQRLEMGTLGFAHPTRVFCFLEISLEPTGNEKIMIAVSDTSIINNLAAIHQLHLLRELYGTVLIPEAVYRELTNSNFSGTGAPEVRSFDWIQTRAVSDRTLVEGLSNELDLGKAEAIVLAIETHADQVLIDEHRGRLVAARLNLQYTGILSILIEAKSQSLITVPSLYWML